MVASPGVDVSGAPGLLPGSPSVADLSVGARSVLGWLRQMPLSSVKDLSAFHDLGDHPYYTWLWELKERGLVGVSQLGAARRRVGRWWLTPQGVASFEGVYPVENLDALLTRLLVHLPSLEWFYSVASELTSELGPFHEFQWAHGEPWDAAVLYQRGWVLLFWSGSLQNESKIVARLSRLGESLNRASVLGRGAWPSLLCFVASDHWQRELVFRASRSMGIPGTRVWCAQDGSSAGAPTPGHGRGWIGYAPMVRARPPGSFEQTAGGSLWGLNGVNGALWRLMRGAFEWPLLNFTFARPYLGFRAQQDRRAGGLFRHLLDRELMEESDALGARSYYLSREGVDMLRRQDEVSWGSLSSRHLHVPGQGVPVRGPEGPHEQGLMRFMSGFYEVGLPCAVGWRSWERLQGGSRGGISPDGMVMLGASPFGGGWHYVEWERSARGQSRAYRKLRGYAAGARQDSWPVLFVLWSDRAEQNFHAQGMRLGVEMLTTTMERLEQAGSPLSGCWSFYGESLSLG